ncbi:unnamed protein product [Timema podura]|uniref:Invertebrate defensins family profile domain-containing protein n=1 Tax=Timema podura TaxID=61482 RepID=A0ABN7P5L9_TIMPD|nr:unnamed protein product [Timema podura]
MKVCFKFYLLVALFAMVTGFPAEGDVPGVRVKRFTCDVLSIDTPFGSLNHAGCAVHCLTMGRGYRGGRCRDGVCHCRK